MRLKLKLHEFEYTIVYKRGKENGNSDGLSRMFSGTELEGTVINALTREAEEEGRAPDSEGSINAEVEREREMKSEPVCKDLSEKEIRNSKGNS
jgi:hypothetical protein